MRSPAILLLLLPACGVSARTACEDSVKAAGAALERCEVGTEEGVAELLDSEGGCEAIVEIRDVDQLYDDCLPAIEVIACSDLVAGRLPASCENQFLIER